MDTIRSILLALEKEESLGTLGLSEEVMLHHLDLMIDAGLIEGQALRGHAGQLVGASIQKVTWQGFDFLDEARDEGRWRKAKEKIASAGGAWTIDILKTLLKALLMHDLGLPPSN